MKGRRAKRSTGTEIEGEPQKNKRGKGRRDIQKTERKRGREGGRERERERERESERE